MTAKLILVTGSTGYIASRLIPQLLERGYRVRALARNPKKLQAREWYSQVEICTCQVNDPVSLPATLEGVHTAYYLIHNMSSGHGYTTLEVEGARNFAAAAEKAGVEHIIYLGGLADPEQHIAPHMRSRIETGMTLRRSNVPVTEFRAGVITGSGSISFEMIRFMAELFPVIPGPMWLKNKSQPIAVQNVIDYLLAALADPNRRGGVYEIGVQKTYTYLELMKIYAERRGHKRKFILIPFVPIWFMAFGIDLMTPVPYSIAYALVGGLSSDSVILHDTAEKTFPEVKLMEYESAVGEAMKRLHPLKIERVWEDGSGRVKFVKHEGFFIDHRETKIASGAKAMEAVKRFDQNGDRLFANWLWRLRGMFERLENYYEIELQTEDHLLFRAKLRAPGDGWMEWRVRGNMLTQTAYFAPRGSGGFLYWYLLYPFHAFVFRGLLKTIARKAVVQ